MKIIIAGSSGLVGRTLYSELIDRGHKITRLLRGGKIIGENDLYWDPEHKKLDAQKLEGCDAIINLAGDSIFGRWTTGKKKIILESRVDTTHLLASAVSKLKNPPKVFINASATGFYGTRQDEVAGLVSTPPSGFLAEVCRQWEHAADPLKATKVRAIFLRFGAILCKEGGALKNMLLPFKLGLGGKLGDGTQWMSWISMADVIRAIFFLLENEKSEGAYHLVTPNAVTNKEFTQILGKVLRRPTVLSMPRWVVRLVFGQLADELLLYSANIKPTRLQEAGFEFQYPLLEDALRHSL